MSDTQPLLALSSSSGSCFRRHRPVSTRPPLMNKEYDKWLHFNSLPPLQVWRALRLIVDSGLHFKGLSRQKALQFFADYAWDESDTATREVTRYQSAPGQATAYMIGQQHIKKLRNDAQAILGDKFDLRDFHYHLLSQGSSPLSHLEQSILAYVNCVKNEKAAGCYDVLNPAVKDEDGGDDDVIDDSDDRPIRRPRRHYF